MRQASAVTVRPRNTCASTAYCFDGKTTVIMITQRQNNLQLASQCEIADLQSTVDISTEMLQVPSVRWSEIRRLKIVALACEGNNNMAVKISMASLKPT